MNYFMDKKIKLTEQKLKTIIKTVVNDVITEGIDIDYESGVNTVAFNPNHQNYVNTNDPWTPIPFYNEVRGYKVISFFERKVTDDKQDGNPLIWALKKKDWVFKNPHYDLFSLLRRFVAVTKELNEHFDVIITTPSSNDLNNEIFNRIKRIIPHENDFENFFEKYEANWVYENLIDSTWLEKHYPIEQRKKILNQLYKNVMIMNKNNNGVFSYKYIKPKEMRDIIIQSMFVSNEYKDDLEFGKYINGKRILVLDDTVTSGKTISDSANAILETFEPKDITFLTLFTPLQKTI